MSSRNPLQFIKNRFLRDAATLQVSGMLNQGSQLVSSVVIAYLLGAHGQGLFFSAAMLQALFYNMLSVGMVPAAVSQVAAAASRELKEKVADWLAFLVKSYLIVSAIMIGAGYFALPAISVWWYSELTTELNPEEALELGRWAWWLTFWILLDIPRAMAQVAFHATRRMLALGQLDNAQELMRMFLVISGALITGSAKGAILGEIASRGLSSLLAMALYARSRREDTPYLPSMAEVLRRVPGIPLRKGIRLGLRIGAIKTPTIVVTTVAPKLLIGGLAGMSWVSYFALAQRFMGLSAMLMQGVSRTSMPALAEQRAKRDLAGFKRLYLRTTLLTGGAISGLILIGLPLVGPVVGMIYPEDFAGPVSTCCMILAIGAIPASFAVALDPFYILCDRMRQNLIISVLALCLTIPGNVLLIYLLPTTGPVWAQSLYQTLILAHFAYVARYFRTMSPNDKFWRK